MALQTLPLKMIAVPQKLRSIIPASLVSNAFFFGLYDAPNDTPDKLGNAADAEITGTTTGTDANAGWFTGNTAAYYALAGDSVVDDVCRMDLGGQIILAWDYYEATALTGSGVSRLWSYGRQVHSASVESRGGYCLNCYADGRIRLDVRWPGDTGNTIVITSSAVTTDQRNQWVLDMNIDAGTMDFYVNGAIDASASDVDFSNPVTTDAAGLLIGCRYGFSAPDAFITSDQRLSDMLGIRLSGADTLLAQAIATEMYAQRHETPFAIEGE